VARAAAHNHRNVILFTLLEDNAAIHRLKSVSVRLNNSGK
jgi:hypothetical protein